MMARVSVPFTEGHYYGGGERPNTELADNSPSACRKINPWQILIVVLSGRHMTVFYTKMSLVVRLIKKLMYL